MMEEIGRAGCPSTTLVKKRVARILCGEAAFNLPSRSESTIHLALSLVTAVTLFLASCAAPDTRHQVIISVPEQRLALLEDGGLIATYPISTSKFAISDAPGSRGTPLGELEIARKIGGSAPLGAVFKDRRRTGEVLMPDAPGRDPIVTRILWLRGRERQNANAYGRYIYIHGTPEEGNVGRPASYGCVRMKSIDVMRLYDVVGEGARVSIVDAPLAAAVLALSPPAGQVAVTERAQGAAAH